MPLCHEHYDTSLGHWEQKCFLGGPCPLQVRVQSSHDGGKTWISRQLRCIRGGIDRISQENLPNHIQSVSLHRYSQAGPWSIDIFWPIQAWDQKLFGIDATGSHVGIELEDLLILDLLTAREYTVVESAEIFLTKLQFGMMI